MRQINHPGINLLSYAELSVKFDFNNIKTDRSLPQAGRDSPSQSDGPRGSHSGGQSE